MAVKQVSVFLENKKGSLSAISKILADAGIDIYAMTLADTLEYGIARLIVSNADKALVELAKAEQTANVREVCGFKVPDKTGGLAGVLALLESNDVNIEYMYAIVTSETENAHIVARVDDNEKAEKILVENGIALLEI